MYISLYFLCSIFFKFVLIILKESTQEMRPDRADLHITECAIPFPCPGNPFQICGCRKTLSSPGLYPGVAAMDSDTSRYNIFIC